MTIPELTTEGADDTSAAIIETTEHERSWKRYIADLEQWLNRMIERHRQPVVVKTSEESNQSPIHHDE